MGDDDFLHAVDEVAHFEAVAPVLAGWGFGLGGGPGGTGPGFGAHGALCQSQTGDAASAPEAMSEAEAAYQAPIPLPGPEVPFTPHAMRPPAGLVAPGQLPTQPLNQHALR